jgi:hypothetical protein
LDVRFLSAFGQRETTLSADKQRKFSPEESKSDCSDVERKRAVGAPLRRRQINGVIFDRQDCPPHKKTRQRRPNISATLADSITSQRYASNTVLIEVLNFS